MQTYVNSVEYTNNGSLECLSVFNFVGVIDKNMANQTTLTMLGTGYATATRCYNTCFHLKNENDVLLVDAGGGNQILSRLEKSGLPLTAVHHLYLTHAHTDHVLGAVWVLRMVMQQMRKDAYDGCLHVYGHDKVLMVLRWICEQTLPGKLTALLGSRVVLHEVKNGDEFQVGRMKITAFDIYSTKEKQFGFRALLPKGKILVCLGDEPYNERSKPFLENADWLLSEAFCLYADRERYKPYEKHHSTARDAAILAGQLGVSNLVLYHTEDRSLSTRKARYTEEAENVFKGRVFVPDDLETIVVEE